MAKRKNEAVWIESRARWQINVQKDGVRKTFVSSVKGKKGKIAAEHRADAWMESLCVNGDTKVTPLLDAWFEDLQRTTSKSHWRQQRNYIENWIRPFIGSKRIGAVTDNDLQRIIDNYFIKGNEGKGVSKKTLMNLRSCISGFMKYCRSRRCTMLVPEFMTIPKNARYRGKAIATQDDLKKLFSSDQTTDRGRPMQDFYIHAYRFLVVTGLRPGELIALQNVDIREDRLVVKRSINDNNELTQGKNENAVRTYTLPKIALSILNEQRDMLKHEGLISKYVFPRRDGSFIPQQKLRKCWQRYCAVNGIEGANTPYEMRHTFVSVVDEMPDALKKMVVGHSKSMDTMGIYSHEKRGDMERAAAYIDHAFANVINDYSE